MQAEIQKKLRKIKDVSTVLRTICAGALVFIVLVGIACVVVLTLGVGGVNYDNMIFGTARLALGSRLILGFVTALAFAALIKCFYHLHRLFGNYRRGEIFTLQSVGELRQFGIGCLLWSVMNFVWGLALVLFVHPVRSFHAHFDSLGIGVIIVVIAWFMDMAVDLHEENELTI